MFYIGDVLSISLPKKTKKKKKKKKNHIILHHLASFRGTAKLRSEDRTDVTSCIGALRDKHTTNPWPQRPGPRVTTRGGLTSAWAESLRRSTKAQTTPGLLLSRVQRGPATDTTWPDKREVGPATDTTWPDKREVADGLNWKRDSLSAVFLRIPGFQRLRLWAFCLGRSRWETVVLSLNLLRDFRMEGIKKIDLTGQPKNQRIARIESENVFEKSATKERKTTQNPGFNERKCSGSAHTHKIIPTPPPGDFWPRVSRG